MRVNWNDCAKRLLKAELVKRGVTHAQLAILLNNMGVDETKSAIDSKMSRGTFSASFLLQCLNAIGCQHLPSAISETRIPKQRKISKRNDRK